MGGGCNSFVNGPLFIVLDPIFNIMNVLCFSHHATFLHFSVEFDCKIIIFFFIQNNRDAKTINCIEQRSDLQGVSELKASNDFIPISLRLSVVENGGGGSPIGHCNSISQWLLVIHHVLSVRLNEKSLGTTSISCC